MYFKFVVNKAQMLSLLLEIAEFLQKKAVGECWSILLAIRD